MSKPPDKGRTEGTEGGGAEGGEATKKKKKKKKKGGTDPDFLHPMKNPTGTRKLFLCSICEQERHSLVVICCLLLLLLLI